jgi:uncharacterized cupin superfamily protein
VSLPSLDVVAQHTQALAGLGYQHVHLGDFDAVYPFFARPPEWPSTHHVHLCVAGGEQEARHLAFRDALRRQPELAADYLRLKRSLAAQHHGDTLASREAYSLSKTEFVEAVLAQSGLGAAALSETTRPIAILASAAPARSKPSNYPEPFASRVGGRLKRPLGDLFGLANFGVNLTRLTPGAISALRHAHTLQDEFIYVLEGHPTLVTDAGDTLLQPGMCAGFRAGTGDGHQLVNRTADDVVYLEVGDRTPGDTGSYPDDDLRAVSVEGRWRFTHKDGTPY